MRRELRQGAPFRRRARWAAEPSSDRHQAGARARPGAMHAWLVDDHGFNIEFTDFNLFIPFLDIVISRIFDFKHVE